MEHFFKCHTSLSSSDFGARFTELHRQKLGAPPGASRLDTAGTGKQSATGRLGYRSRHSREDRGRSPPSLRHRDLAPSQTPWLFNGRSVSPGSYNEKKNSPNRAEAKAIDPPPSHSKNGIPRIIVGRESLPKIVQQALSEGRKGFPEADQHVLHLDFSFAGDLSKNRCDLLPLHFIQDQQIVLRVACTDAPRLQ